MSSTSLPLSKLFGRLQKPRPFESKYVLDSESSTLERLSTTLSALCFSVFYFPFCLLKLCFASSYFLKLYLIWDYLNVGHLGTFTSYLKWNLHIRNVCSKANRTL